MASAVEAAMPTLQSWVGRKRIVEDEIGLTAVRRIAGMLDLDPASFTAGTVLPPHWFTMFFADIARQSQIGPDGHPDKGVFLPPIPLPRRMGAGRRVRIMGRLRAAEPARKIAEVAAITPKRARTGEIVVLTMRHTIEARGETVAVDEFDAIYREAVPPGTKTAATEPTPAPADAAWSDSIHLSSALVFRYSAVTWNAHRIHYDADYARDEEGYPHTVQNGGLSMQLMLDAALKRSTGELTGFTARLVNPIWVGETIALQGHAAKDGRMTCWVANGKGALCGQMELELGA
jgi:3-methylfumaryl-CoA hydratase